MDSYQEMAEPEKYWTRDDFKEHVHKELNWSRMGWDGIPQDGYPISDTDWHGMVGPYHWIFWTREHDDPDPLMTLSYDNWSLATNNRTLKDKVRLALRKILLHNCTGVALVQFWAATKALDGRTLLTTQDQPFALTQFSHSLCEYRMISKDYTFYVDGRTGEEELGIPGRVYLNKCPECTPNVEYYSVKEYPQRDSTLRCGVRQSWNLPVIEHSSQACVGVLELVGQFWLGEISDSVDDAFQVLGLKCFNCEHHEMRKKKNNKAHQDALMKIERALKLVCKIHKIPLALTWVPCEACETLLPIKEDLCIFWDYNDVTISDLYDFLMSRFGPPLRNGIGVVGRALTSPNLLYCSDVTQFSMAEYPWAHFARQCRLRDCFAISLWSNYTGNDVYVLEIFLSVSNKEEDPLTSLSKLLETMKKEFKTFRFASGEELGEELSVEVIEFQNGQKRHYVQTLHVTGSLPSLEPLQNGGEIMQVDSSDHQSIDAEQCEIDVNHPQELGTNKTSGREHKNTGVRIEIPYEDILHYSKLSRSDAARNLKVSISTFKRVCRQHGISRWPPRQVDKVRPPRPSHVDHHEEVPQLISNLPSNQASARIAHTQPHDTALQIANTVNVKAKYVKGLTLLFPLSLSSTLEELYECIETRLDLSHGTYHACYIDGDNDKITVTCDQDLQFWLCHSPRSPGSNAIVLHIDPISQVTVRAKYVNDITIKFQLSLSSGLVELQQQVAKRLNLEAGSYHIKYKDEEDELILIACDEDLQDCIHTCRSLGSTSIVVLLELK
ncbi:protein NLP7-like isoform X2 [Actinidia eriantha]|uniref:protein NLP7-like isoform X2 n=1 Tax=Actinidia eriantha TaxID=165200 RepID=UPI00258AEC67|nr:protein NLP7-like isoform X2 [Actinidia eriantha]